MSTLEGAVLVRIYTDQDALSGDRSLFEAIVARARAASIAGATVLHGRMGYGHSSVVHAHRPFDLSDNLPVVIELVDQEQKLRRFVEDLSGTADIGLITFEKVEVVRYGAGRDADA